MPERDYRRKKLVNRIGFFSSIALLLLLITVSMKTGIVPFLETTTTAINAYAHELWTFGVTDHQVNGFVIIVALLLLVYFVVYFIRKIIRVDEKGSYKRYTEDVFLNVTWKWKWMMHLIVRLRPYCPNCEMEVKCDRNEHLQNRDNKRPCVAFYCNRCKRIVAYTEYNETNKVEEYVKKQIKRKANEKPRQDEVS